VAEISRVIRAVGYPKAMVKKVLIGLSNKGAVSLYRHDWPASLKPEQRKLMVRIGRDYYNAVSVMKRNPKGKHLRSATAKEQRQYEAVLKSIKKSGRYKGREKEVAARTVFAQRQNPKRTTGKGKTALKRTGQALKSFARGALESGAEILGAGAMALNPSRRRKKAKKATKRKRNKTVIKAKRVVVVNPKKKRVKRNASRSSHPNSSKTRRAGASRKTGQKAKPAKVRSVAETRKSATRRLAGRATKKRNALKRVKMPAWIKTAIRRARREGADRAVASEMMHASKAQRDAFDQYLISIGHPSVYEAGTQEYRIKRFVKERSGKRNPSAESIRKEFAGSVSGSRDLYFPQGTPTGKLAKLGKLVSITTEEGTIKPVSGTAWLCADTRGKLHIGSTTKAPLFDGPKRSFGHVTKLEYESRKPHLGYRGPIIWFHRAGEENGVRPTLKTDGKGGLVFKGGDYRLTRRGIEN
jgi:hypothetical protein